MNKSTALFAVLIFISTTTQVIPMEIDPALQIKIYTEKLVALESQQLPIISNYHTCPTIENEYKKTNKTPIIDLCKEQSNIHNYISQLLNKVTPDTKNQYVVKNIIQKIVSYESEKNHNYADIKSKSNQNKNPEISAEVNEINRLNKLQIDGYKKLEFLLKLLEKIALEKTETSNKATWFTYGQYEQTPSNLKKYHSKLFEDIDQKEFIE